jgi:hypothetical protein
MSRYSVEDIEAVFGQHKMGEITFAKFSEIKGKFRELALWVKENVPPCDRQTLCLDKLIEAKDCATMGFLTEAVKAGINTD